MAFYVKIEKRDETPESATYAFWSAPDNAGSLRIDKASGEVSLLTPIGGDERALLYTRAAMKLRREWQQGRLPDAAEWAS
jgi:hypothetical protein